MKLESGENTTNRCMDVACKLDAQCQSGYCEVNARTVGSEPSHKCSKPEDKPTACNNSLLFNSYDGDEHLHEEFSVNLCVGATCLMDKDCKEGLSCNPNTLGTGYSCSEGKVTCNNSVHFITDRKFVDGKQVITKEPSANRCFGTKCSSDAGQCFKNDTLTSQCFNGTCRVEAVTCNSTRFGFYKDDETQDLTLIPAVNRCNEVPCGSDTQCLTGAQCFSGLCTSGEEKHTCNKTTSYQVFNDDKLEWGSVDALNRCKGVKCLEDK